MCLLKCTITSQLLTVLQRLEGNPTFLSGDLEKRDECTLTWVQVMCTNPPPHFPCLCGSALFSVSISFIVCKRSVSLTSSRPWTGCRGCSSRRRPAAGGTRRWRGDSPALSGHCTGLLCLTCQRESNSVSLAFMTEDGPTEASGLWAGWCHVPQCVMIWISLRPLAHTSLRLICENN